MLTVRLPEVSVPRRESVSACSSLAPSGFFFYAVVFKPLTQSHLSLNFLKAILCGLALAWLTSCTTSTPKSGDESKPSSSEVRKPTVADLKAGMTQNELTQMLGFPQLVEGKGAYEIWTYPSGKVYFSPTIGVMAWMDKVTRS